MELMNKLGFGTPSGLQNSDMERVKSKLLEDFDWLNQNDFSVVDIELAEADGTIEFTFDDTYYDMRVKVIFHKSGTGITVTSNDPNAAIDVFNSLCQLEWGWIEV